LANPSIRIVALVVVVVLMGASFAIYYENTASTLTGQEETISGLQSSVSSLQSHPLISTSTVTVSTTLTSTSTVRSVSVTTSQVMPFQYSDYMTPPNIYTSGSVISFNANINDAIQFDCPNETVPETCTVQFPGNSTILATSFNMTYPEFGQVIDNGYNEPGWANCIVDAYVLPPDTETYMLNSQAFGYCFQVNPQVDPGTFVVAEPFPGPV
jgi:hypothetical protein